MEKILNNSNIWDLHGGVEAVERRLKKYGREKNNSENKKSTNSIEYK